MLVHSDFHTVRHASFKDELGILAGDLAAGKISVRWTLWGLEYHEKCLDDVVAVHVHGQLHHLLIEGLDHLLKGEMIELLELCWIWSIIFDHISCHFVDQSLHCSRPMDVQRDVHQVSQARHDDPVERLRVCHLDDLLAQVIAELVCHYIRKNGQYLIDQAFWSEDLCIPPNRNSSNQATWGSAAPLLWGEGRGVYSSWTGCTWNALAKPSSE